MNNVLKILSIYVNVHVVDNVVLANPTKLANVAYVLDPVSYRYKENMSSTTIGTVLDVDDGKVVVDGKEDNR